MQPILWPRRHALPHDIRGRKISFAQIVSILCYDHAIRENGLSPRGECNAVVLWEASAGILIIRAPSWIQTRSERDEKGSFKRSRGEDKRGVIGEGIWEGKIIPPSAHAPSPSTFHDWDKMANPLDRWHDQSSTHGKRVHFRVSEGTQNLSPCIAAAGISSVYCRSSGIPPA